MSTNIPSTSTSEFRTASAARSVPAKDKPENAEVSPDKKYKRQIVWINVFRWTFLHLGSLYGIYLIVTSTSKLYTFLWAYLAALIGGIGVTAGAHRLWSHRAYKAKWPLRVILAFMQTLAIQNSIYVWCRDHRVHHKFSETDADPHNALRGFFFSHIGWLMCRKHPDVIRKGAGVDLSDLEQDPIVMWQKKYYVILVSIVSVIFPIFVPWYFWGEPFWTSFWTAGIFRYVLNLNSAWLVNSAAHIWGAKPFDKNINPSDNKSVAILAYGEGWHNYHHVFPWDYKAAELGNYNMNFTTGFIDFFAKIGWAYDLKTVPVEIVRKRAERTGDGSHKRNDDAAQQQPEETPIWGWGDTDMLIEDTRAAVREHREQ